MPPKKKVTKEELKKAEESIKNPEPKKDKSKKFISTGSTLLNLALSDRIDGGFPLGDMVNLVGDSNSGKTLISLSMMADAVRKPEFDDYKFVYYAVETGLYFPMDNLFGKHIKRIELKQKSPYTIKQWVKSIVKKSQKPIICVLDSADALTTEEELKIMNVDDGKDTKERKEGFSNLLKPKEFSATLSPVLGCLGENNSVLVVISQTRENIGVMYGAAKRRAGGIALKFYSSCEVWLSVAGKIVKRVRGAEREVGEYVRVRVARSRLTGKKREVVIPIISQDGYGIDDIGSMVDWLVQEDFWGVIKPEKEDKEKTKREEAKESKALKKSMQIIDTGGDFENLSRDKLIEYIEQNNLENDLRDIVQESWDTLEEEMSMNRKPKYS